MSSPGVPPYEVVLRLCHQAAPDPWFPDEFAKSMGIHPARLEQPLDELSIAGLIAPGEWQPGRGQGYLLTDAGERAAHSPDIMHALRGGRLPGDRRAEEELDGERAPAAASPRRNAVHACLRNSARPIVTYLIFGLNVGLFLIGMSIALAGNWGQVNLKLVLIGGDAHARHVTGAVTAANLDDGQWWRLLATLFVHRDLFHLLINMSTFLAWGRRAEQLWGRWRYLLIYLLSGLAFACLSLWHDPATTPLGAAGSIFGVMLSLAAWFALNRRQMPSDLFRQGIRQVLLAFVWFMAWLTLFAWLSVPNLRLADLRLVGHGAGAAAGLILGVLLNEHRFNPGMARWLFLALVPLLPAASVGLLLHAKAGDPAWSDAAAVQRKQQEAAEREAARQRKNNREKSDFDRFNTELLPEINKAEAFFEKKWNRVERLCEEEADRRGAALAEARDAVRQARQDTDAALAAIAAAGKFDVEHVENTTITARRFLDEQKKLLELAGAMLESKADPTDREIKALRQQAEETRSSWKAYNQNFK